MYHRALVWLLFNSPHRPRLIPAVLRGRTAHSFARLRFSSLVGFRCVAGGAPNPTQKRYPCRGANTQIAPQTRKGITSAGVAPALACMRAKGGAPRRGWRPPSCAYSTAPHDAGRVQSPKVARLLSFVGGVVGARGDTPRAEGLCAMPCRPSVPATPIAPCGRLTRQKKYNSGRSGARQPLNLLREML